MSEPHVFVIVGAGPGWPGWPGEAAQTLRKTGFVGEIVLLGSETRTAL